ncbi:MAG: hypothetical protein ACP5UH_01245 [Candidatus Micrarchaeia archaeon]
MQTPRLYIMLAAVLAALVVSGITIIIACHLLEYPFAKYASEGSAGIDAVINSNGYIVSDLNVSVSGNGTNLSVPLSIVSRCFVAIPENVSQPSLPHIATTTIPGIYTEPCNITEHIIFAGLRPHSIYGVAINGSERPYCPPGIFCPYFILRVQKSVAVETGPNGSITTVSFSV